MTRSWRFLLAALIFTQFANAHEVRPAHLSVSELSNGRFFVRWKVPAMGDRRLAIDPVFVGGCFEAGDKVDSFTGGAYLRSWYINCPDGIAGTEIGFSNLPATMVDVLVHVTFLDGRDHTGLVRPTQPVFRVPARDSEASIFGSYFGIGVEHILFGWDHLLFVLGLVLLVTDRRRLIWAVTGFTIAHSLTLALAVFDLIRVPGPPVEAAVALSIVLLAVEVLRFRRSGVETLAIRAPWAVSMTIGLVHGLGFAGALSEYGLPAHARIVSLLAFNLGVEAGQLVFIGGLIVLGLAARRMESRLVSPLRQIATIFMGVCGSFWLVERLAGFYN